MNIFTIDYKKLINMLLPVRLRGNIMQALLQALTVPVVYIYTILLSFRNNNLYYLAHTSQVVYMQAALNDIFDVAQRRIIITDDQLENAIPVYLPAENHNVALYLAIENTSLPLYLDDEVMLGTSDFVVQIPSSVVFNTPHMRAVIDTYRLRGKSNYIIQTI